MDKQKVYAFLRDTCTTAEAREVLDWLGTAEGQEFLREELDRDEQRVATKEVAVPPVDSEKIFARISDSLPTSVESLGYRAGKNRSGHWQWVAAAAVILFIVVFGMLQFGVGTEEQDAAMRSSIYETGPNERLELTLNDHTRIQLNANSRIEIPTLAGARREVSLHGEAFFKVARNKDRPFIIHANQTTITVLGTSFNVKSRLDAHNVQVAVQEGKVAVEYRPGHTAQNNARVLLTAGMFGLVDFDEGGIHIEKASVQNYWSWMNRRLSFTNNSLAEVSRQLSILYDTEFVFATNDLKSERISADFENVSFKKTLQVIATTLNIRYRMNDGVVHWIR